MICLAGSLAQKGALQCFCSSVPETKAFLKWLEIRTQQRLDAHWKTVELIANALLERKRLSGKEFAELMRPRYYGLLPNILPVDRNKLPHGKFQEMFRDDPETGRRYLPFGEPTSQKLQAIAGHEVLSNPTHGGGQKRKPQRLLGRNCGHSGRRPLPPRLPRMRNQ